MQMQEAVYQKLPQNILKWQDEENDRNKEPEYEF